MQNKNSVVLHVVQSIDECRYFKNVLVLLQTITRHKLLQTITRPSIEKYLPLAKKLVTKYDVDPYLKGRIMTLSDEIELLFGKGDGSQQLLTDFVN